jgi:high-affinity Fe2+/Pb2+ permease
MKKFLPLLTLSDTALAHHTQEHTMLQQDSAKVIAETQQGETGFGWYLLWALLALVLIAGLVRNKKK